MYSRFNLSTSTAAAAPSPSVPSYADQPLVLKLSTERNFLRQFNIKQECQAYPAKHLKNILEQQKFHSPLLLSFQHLTSIQTQIADQNFFRAYGPIREDRADERENIAELGHAHNRAGVEPRKQALEAFQSSDLNNLKRFVPGATASYTQLKNDHLLAFSKIFERLSNLYRPSYHQAQQEKWLLTTEIEKTHFLWGAIHQWLLSLENGAAKDQFLQKLLNERTRWTDCQAAITFLNELKETFPEHAPSLDKIGQELSYYTTSHLQLWFSKLKEDDRKDWIVRQGVRPEKVYDLLSAQEEQQCAYDLSDVFKNAEVITHFSQCPIGYIKVIEYFIMDMAKETKWYQHHSAQVFLIFYTIVIDDVNYLEKDFLEKKQAFIDLMSAEEGSENLEKSFSLMKKSFEDLKSRLNALMNCFNDQRNSYRSMGGNTYPFKFSDGKTITTLGSCLPGTLEALQDQFITPLYQSTVGRDDAGKEEEKIAFAVENYYNTLFRFFYYPAEKQYTDYLQHTLYQYILEDTDAYDKAKLEEQLFHTENLSLWQKNLKAKLLEKVQPFEAQMYTVFVKMMQEYELQRGVSKKATVQKAINDALISLNLRPQDGNSQAWTDSLVISWNKFVDQSQLRDYFENKSDLQACNLAVEKAFIFIFTWLLQHDGKFDLNALNPHGFTIPDLKISQFRAVFKAWRGSVKDAVSGLSLSGPDSKDLALTINLYTNSGILKIQDELDQALNFFHQLSQQPFFQILMLLKKWQELHQTLASTSVEEISPALQTWLSSGPYCTLKQYHDLIQNLLSSGEQQIYPPQVQDLIQKTQSLLETLKANKAILGYYFDWSDELQSQDFSVMTNLTPYIEKLQNLPQLFSQPISEEDLHRAHNAPLSFILDRITDHDSKLASTLEAFFQVFGQIQEQISCHKESLNIIKKNLFAQKKMQNLRDETFALEGQTACQIYTRALKGSLLGEFMVYQQLFAHYDKIFNSYQVSPDFYPQSFTLSAQKEEDQPNLLDKLSSEDSLWSHFLGDKKETTLYLIKTDYLYHNPEDCTTFKQSLRENFYHYLAHIFAPLTPEFFACLDQLGDGVSETGLSFELFLTQPYRENQRLEAVRMRESIQRNWQETYHHIKEIITQQVFPKKALWSSDFEQNPEVFFQRIPRIELFFERKEKWIEDLLKEYFYHVEKVLFAHYDRDNKYSQRRQFYQGFLPRDQSDHQAYCLASGAAFLGDFDVFYNKPQTMDTVSLLDVTQKQKILGYVLEQGFLSYSAALIRDYSSEFSQETIEKEAVLALQAGQLDAVSCLIHHYYQNYQHQGHHLLGKIFNSYLESSELKGYVFVCTVREFGFLAHLYQQDYKKCLSATAIHHLNQAMQEIFGTYWEALKTGYFEVKHWQDLPQIAPSLLDLSTEKSPQTLYTAYRALTPYEALDLALNWNPTYILETFFADVGLDKDLVSKVFLEKDSAYVDLRHRLIAQIQNALSADTDEDPSVLAANVVSLFEQHELYQYLFASKHFFQNLHKKYGRLLGSAEEIEEKLKLTPADLISFISAEEKRLCSTLVRAFEHKIADFLVSGQVDSNRTEAEEKLLSYYYRYKAVAVLQQICPALSQHEADEALKGYKDDYEQAFQQITQHAKLEGLSKVYKQTSLSDQEKLDFLIRYWHHFGTQIVALSPDHQQQIAVDCDLKLLWPQKKIEELLKSYILSLIRERGFTDLRIENRLERFELWKNTLKKLFSTQPVEIQQILSSKFMWLSYDGAQPKTPSFQKEIAKILSKKNLSLDARVKEVEVYCEQHQQTQETQNLQWILELIQKVLQGESNNPDSIKHLRFCIQDAVYRIDIKSTTKEEKSSWWIRMLAFLSAQASWCYQMLLQLLTTATAFVGLSMPATPSPSSAGSSNQPQQENLGTGPKASVVPASTSDKRPK